MRSSRCATVLASLLRVSPREWRPAALTMRRFLIAFAAALALPRAAAAMEYRTLTDPYGRFVIYATGSIGIGDADRFRYALDEAGTNRPHLVMNSGGGIVHEGMRIARMVASARVPVVVGDMCASACFLVFAASPDRTVSPSARVGVHRAFSRATGGESERSLNVTMDMARHAAALGVPAPIVTRMVTTPGGRNSIEWLTADDLRSMNVTFTQPAAPQRAAAAAVAAAAQRPATAGTMAELGRADRLTYRRWLAGLSDSGREGAEFWLKQRRSPRPKGCLGGTSAFSLACFEAQRWWARVDERSRDPDYRRAWEGL